MLRSDLKRGGSLHYLHFYSTQIPIPFLIIDILKIFRDTFPDTVEPRYNDVILLVTILYTVKVEIFTVH